MNNNNCTINLDEIKLECTIKNRMDKLIDTLKINDRILDEMMLFLFNETMPDDPTPTIESFSSALDWACSKAYYQREFLYGIANRMGLQVNFEA